MWCFFVDRFFTGQIIQTFGLFSIQSELHSSILKFVLMIIVESRFHPESLTTIISPDHVIFRQCFWLLFCRSERVSKTGVNGVLLQEAKYINLSLHFLEQVIDQQCIHCHGFLFKPKWAHFMCDARNLYYKGIDVIENKKAVDCNNFYSIETKHNYLPFVFIQDVIFYLY